MKQRPARTLAFLAAIAALAAGVATPAVADVSAKDPWVAETPPGATTAAAYLVFANSGAAAVDVVSARSPSCERVEFHTTDLRDGIARMRPQASLAVPARGELAFAPGGTHLMLIRPQALHAGDVVAITFELSNGEQLEVAAAVKRPGDAAATEHHEHHH